MIGFACGLMVSLLTAVALVAISPPELRYRSHPTTYDARPPWLGRPLGFIELPPCTGTGKDCSAATSSPKAATYAWPYERHGSIWLIPVPEYAPYVEVTEPGSLSLLLVAAAALVLNRRVIS